MARVIASIHTMQAHVSVENILGVEEAKSCERNSLRPAGHQRRRNPRQPPCRRGSHRGHRTDSSVDEAFIVVPGFIDLHVHGWGGHDAMGGTDALSGMARALAGRGVTSFLPTSVTASFEKLTVFADSVRTWMPVAPRDGAEALGFNMEGPFLSQQKRGAHPVSLLRHPADLPEDRLATFTQGLRVITIAPELRGAPELIRRLANIGVRVSLGHSAATLSEARSGFTAGAVTTTHLFNAMIGVVHREPGLALEALLNDDVWVELRDCQETTASGRGSRGRGRSA